MWSLEEESCIFPKIYMCVCDITVIHTVCSWRLIFFFLLQFDFF